MFTQEEKRTWALLPDNKLLPGSYALSHLGCIVADVENPTDHFVPQDISKFQEDPTTPQVFSTTEMDSSKFLASACSMDVSARLASILTTVKNQTQAQATNITSAKIVTRSLEQHLEFFERLEKRYKSEIEQFFRTRVEAKNRDVAYMIVGIKTCLDAKLESLQTLQNGRSGGASVPVVELLQGAGIAVPDLSSNNSSGSDSSGADKTLDIRVEAYRKRVEGLFTKYTAEGERVFAIQYREVKRVKAWKKIETYHLRRLHGVRKGLFGKLRMEEDSDDSDQDSDSQVGNDADDDCEEPGEPSRKGDSSVLDGPGDAKAQTEVPQPTEGYEEIEDQAAVENGDDFRLESEFGPRDLWRIIW